MKHLTLLACAISMAWTVQVHAAAATEIPAVPVSTVDPASAAADLQSGQRPDAKKTQKATQDNKKPAMKSPATSVASSVINRSGTVLVLPGQNTVIPIARNQPNRILTPFKSPQVLSTDLTGGKGDDCGEACVRGRVVYISTDQTKPVTAFITEKNREDIAISVTMIPERIAPRQVELKLPEETMRALASNSSSGMVMGDSDAAQAWEAGQPYVTMLRDTFREVALGNVPQGYTLRSVSRKDQLPRCIQDGLAINFKDGQVLEGHNINVYVGTIENVSDEAIEFIEQECGDWNTAAVTSYPLKVLRPKQVTEVYVAVKREQERPSGTVRKPLIKREFR